MRNHPTPPAIPSKALKPLWHRKLAAPLMAISWLTCIIAWLFIFILQVESVLFTGPIIFILGAALLRAGIATNKPWTITLGLAHITVTLLFVSLVNIFQWSPHQAEKPFTIIASIYLFAITPATFLAWRYRPHPFEPWQCQSCGYNLFNLPRPRCPECGTPFDPQTIQQPNPQSPPKTNPQNPLNYPPKNINPHNP